MLQSILGSYVASRHHFSHKRVVERAENCSLVRSQLQYRAVAYMSHKHSPTAHYHHGKRGSHAVAHAAVVVQTVVGSAQYSLQFGNTECAAIGKSLLNHPLNGLGYKSTRYLATLQSAYSITHNEAPCSCIGSLRSYRILLALTLSNLRVAVWLIYTYLHKNNS